jgi:hypothetical protein
MKGALAATRPQRLVVRAGVQFVALGWAIWRASHTALRRKPLEPETSSFVVANTAPDS